MALFSSSVSDTDKRANLRGALDSGRLQRWPGAFSPLVAKIVAEAGFEGVYVSGAALSADLGLPDIGLTTLTEVAERGGLIARATDLPTLIDADTGFGEPMSAARTIAALEDAGLSGCHLEDQVNPKRCGHLDGKEVVPAETMIKRLAAAVGARRDPNFIICARTDARGVEGLDAAIERAKAYVDAGADLIFTEALADLDEFRRFREAVDAPLLANMTEFGKTPIIPLREFEKLGYNCVIWPVTTLRAAMGEVTRILGDLKRDGDVSAFIGRVQDRKGLYELLGYTPGEEWIWPGS